MAQYNKSTIVSGSVSTSRPQNPTYTVTVSKYWEVTVTNTDTAATVTMTPTEEFAESNSYGSFSSYIEKNSGSSNTGRWQPYNSTTSTLIGSQVSMVAKAADYATTASMGSTSFTVTKTKTTQSITVRMIQPLSGQRLVVSIRGSGSGTSGTKIVTGLVSEPSVPTITINPKTSYTVSYAANGGTGAPGAQTKWYGETLTLSGTKPTRTGYTFANWKATNGTTYAAGGSYTANAATTMTAQWTANKYTVTFNQNGGSGMSPTTQQKTHDVTLALTTSKPSKSGYTFKGWATSEANAKAGTPTYQPGGNYTGNAAITLWAVWELNHVAPSVPNTSVKVIRCDEYGTANDEGTYAKVSFHWSVFTGSPQYYNGSGTGYQTNKAKTCTITVGTSPVIYTVTLDATHSQMSGTANDVVQVLGGTNPYAADSTYPVTITFSDDPPIGSSLTTTVRDTLPTTFFPMDFNADASALGFFMPAPNNGDGAYFGKDVHIYVNSATTAGTDGQIAQALTNLGWTDVLV